MSDRFHVDPDRLRRRAFHYLQRYAASEAQLARVLRRRLEKEARLAEQDLPTADVDAAVEAVVKACRDLGFLDDRSFAETKVASGRRKGHSASRLAQALAVKGVDRDLVTAAIAADDTGELAAAVRFARRRRLGPFRREAPADRKAVETRELAALCRNGFAYALARRVIGMEVEEAEAVLNPDESGGFMETLE